MCGSEPKEFSELGLADDLAALVANTLYDTQEGDVGPAGITSAAGTWNGALDFPEYLELENLVRRNPDNDGNFLITKAGVDRLIAFLQTLNIE